MPSSLPIPSTLEYVSTGKIHEDCFPRRNTGPTRISPYMGRGVPEMGIRLAHAFADGDIDCITRIGVQ